MTQISRMSVSRRISLWVRPVWRVAAIGAAMIVLASPALNAFAGGVSESRRCTMSILPNVRDSLATYIVGTATEDTVLAGPGLVGRALHMGPRPGQRVYGQVVRADTLNGVGAGFVRRAFAERRSRAAVIVPWAYDSGCAIDFWRHSARWVTPDSSGLFSVRRRAESLWVDGIPTFDALYASVRSYVHGPFGAGPGQLSGMAGTMSESDRALTPAEVFGIYIRLPTRIDPPDTATIARLRRWVRANPTLRARYPGNYILQGWTTAQ